jgi:hypothetical protein
MEKIEINEELVLQGLLLDKDELLIYKDELAKYHVLTTVPYQKDKDYKVLFMTWEDLPKTAQAS